MTQQLLMMDVTLPCGKFTSYGPYPADQIIAYCARVKAEHQLTQTKRVLREPNEVELQKEVLDGIFYVKKNDNRG